jgi:hypothetical protein
MGNREGRWAVPRPSLRVGNEVCGVICTGHEGGGKGRERTQGSEGTSNAGSVQITGALRFPQPTAVTLCDSLASTPPRRGRGVPPPSPPPDLAPTSLHSVHGRYARGAQTRSHAQSASTPPTPCRVLPHPQLHSHPTHTRHTCIAGCAFPHAGVLLGAAHHPRVLRRGLGHGVHISRADLLDGSQQLVVHTAVGG